MHNPSDRFGTPDDCAERPLHDITAVGLGHQVASGRSLANVCCLCLPYQGAEVDQIPGRRLQKTKVAVHGNRHFSHDLPKRLFTNDCFAASKSTRQQCRKCVPELFGSSRSRWHATSVIRGRFRCPFPQPFPGRHPPQYPGSVQSIPTWHDLAKAALRASFSCACK